MKQLKLQSKQYHHLVGAYREWLDILGYAPSTVYYLPNHLQEFFYYAEDKGHQTIQSITTKTVSDYYKHLSERANQRRAGGLHQAYLNKHIQALKKFREYLKKHNYHDFNVHLQVEESAPIQSREIVSIKEVEELFKACSKHVQKRIQLRDRAMLVLLYSCGLRRSEAVAMNRDDILIDKSCIHVRKGKNYKARLVPINQKNLDYLLDYLYEGRPEFIKESKQTLVHRNDSEDGEALLLNYRGSRLGGMSLANRLKSLAQQSENKAIISKAIKPHGLRHSIATHLLQSGVSMENIKSFLGHSSLESTQIYTHLIEEERNPLLIYD